MFIIIVIVIVFYLFIDFLKKNFKYKTIKQKWSLPIIGNLHQLGDTPHISVRNISKELDVKVFALYFGDIYTVVVSDMDLLKEIFIKNFKNFSERPRLPSFDSHSGGFRNLGFGDDKYWNRAKKKVANTFQRLKLSSCAYDTLNEETNNLIDAIELISSNNQLFNPRRIYQRCFANIILRYVFNSHTGYNLNDDQYIGKDKSLIELIDAIEVVMKDTSVGNICDYLLITQPFYKLYVDRYGSHNKIVAMLKDIYHEHETTIDYDNPRDLIDSLIIETRNSKDPMLSSTDEYLQNIFIGFDFFVASIDTSSHTLEWFTILMANYPECQLKCYNELKSVVSENSDRVFIKHRTSTPYLNSVIKEVMRFHTVVPLSIPRQSKRDITLSNGMFIPANTQILMNIGGVHTDKDYFESPNQFKPERFLNDRSLDNFNIGFGVGPRKCSGHQLGLDQLYLSCSNLILNFKIKTSIPINESEIFGLTIRPNKFEIKMEKRSLVKQNK